MAGMSPHRIAVQDSVSSRGASQAVRLGPAAKGLCNIKVYHPIHGRCRLPYCFDIADRSEIPSGVDRFACLRIPFLFSPFFLRFASILFLDYAFAPEPRDGILI
jgi:hypothetical protein